MKGKNAITVETQKHDKKNTSDRKDILFEKQAILNRIIEYQMK